MRRSFILFAAGLFIIACNNESSEPEKAMQVSDLATESLSGSIESYEETPYKVDSEGKMGDIDSCCIGFAHIDKNGNYTKWTEKDNKGKVTGETVYERFDNGMWKGSKDSKEGKPSGSTDTKIDSAGKYILAEEFDSTGKLSMYYTNIGQNDYGEVTGWKQFDKDSVFRQEGESKYDSILQTSFVMKDSLGNIKSTNAYKYNDKGELTARIITTVTKDSTTTKTTTYSYDAHDDMGNWTQRTEYDDKGKPVKILKRTYTYYKKE